MTFGESIKTVFKKYAEFNGTASRSEYWWWALLSFLIGLPAQVLSRAIDYNENVGLLLVAGFVSLLYLGWALATLVPSLAVAVRRLRDAGYHWAWLFIALIPIVGTIILIVFLASPSKAGIAQASASTPPTTPPAAA